MNLAVQFFFSCIFCMETPGFYNFCYFILLPRSSSNLLIDIISSKFFHASLLILNCSGLISLPLALLFPSNFVEYLRQVLHIQPIIIEEALLKYILQNFSPLQYPLGQISISIIYLPSFLNYLARHQPIKDLIL